MTNTKEIRKAVSQVTPLQEESSVETKPFQRRSDSFDIPADLPEGEYIAQVESFWNSKYSYKGTPKIHACKQKVITVGLYTTDTRKYLGSKPVWIYGSKGDYGEAMRNTILQAFNPFYEKETDFDSIDRKSFVGKQALCTLVHHGQYTNLTGWKQYKAEDARPVKTDTVIKGAPDVWWDSLTIDQKTAVMGMITTCKAAFAETFKDEPVKEERKEAPTKKPEIPQVQKEPESSNAEDVQPSKQVEVPSTEIHDFSASPDIDNSEDDDALTILPEDIPF